jgi:hypothetical protein
MSNAGQFRPAINQVNMKYLGQPQSGSLAGQTASHNRAGQYLRNRRAPVQPVGSGRRAFIRAAFGAASSGWSALGSALQLSFNAYAAAHPITDALGQSITLTGHQMYVAIATQLANVLEPAPTAVPVTSDTSSPAFSVFTVTHAGVITLTLTPSGGATDFILIAFSAPQSAGVTFNKTFWQQLFVPGNSVGGATYGVAYIAEFGTIPAGSRVFLKLTPVNQYGVTGTPVITSVIVS